MTSDNSGKPVIGLDLGGTNIKGVLWQDGEVTHRDSTKTKAVEGPEAVVARLAKVSGKLMDKAGLKKSEVLGVGVGSAGAIDIEKGVVMESPNLQWSDLPLRDMLAKEIGVDVALDNDVNAGAWGEHKAGAGAGYDELLAVFIGTGIGGGIVLGGKLYHGAFGTAGEIGFNVINANGPIGRRYVEHLASRTSIVNQVVQLIQSNHDSIVPELVDGDLSKVRSKVLAQAVKKDDALVKEVVDAAADYVGISIANAVTLLSLPCVVVGGGLTEALGDYLMDKVRASFHRHVFPQHLRKCEVLASTLEDDANCVGAALLALDRLS